MVCGGDEIFDNTSRTQENIVTSIVKELWAQCDLVFLHCLDKVGLTGFIKSEVPAETRQKDGEIFMWSFDVFGLVR